MGRGRKGEGEHKEKLDCEQPPPRPSSPHPAFISLLRSSIDVDGGTEEQRPFERGPRQACQVAAARGSSIYTCWGERSRDLSARASPTSAGRTPPTPSAARAEHMLRRGRQRRGAGGKALRLTLSGLQRNPVIICQRRGLPPPQSHPASPPPTSSLSSPPWRW